MDHWFFFPQWLKTSRVGGVKYSYIIYYYYVKTLSHSWISLNSRMLQLSGQISKYHLTNFTSAGSDDVTTAYWSLFKVSSSSSSLNLIFLFSISSSSHSPPAGYLWCSRSSAGVDRSSSPRRCWRSSPPPPLRAPPSTGRSPWVTPGDKHNLQLCQEEEWHPECDVELRGLSERFFWVYFFLNFRITISMED